MPEFGNPFSGLKKDRQAIFSLDNNKTYGILYLITIIGQMS